MSGESSRSRAALAAGLTRWFEARSPTDAGITVSVERPQPGLSSDTLMVAVTAVATTDDYVARLPPLGSTLFPDYDLGRQARVQSVLGEHGIPVAQVIALETDESWIDAPFLLMPRVSGRTLTSNPPYVSHGWLTGLADDEQAAVINGVIDLMAKIHRLPVEDLELGPLVGGGPSLLGIVGYWQDFLDWSGASEEHTAIYRRALDWCRTHLPEDPPPAALLWGDPQLTNAVLGDDGRVTALLDFEMASYGPAEVDLAWFLVLHELASETAGETLPGDPGRAAMIARHEATLGRPITDLTWYEVLANIRSGAIVLRIGELMRQAGHSASWVDQVPQPRHLARLIGV